jgi:hypothetical protein
MKLAKSWFMLRPALSSTPRPSSHASWLLAAALLCSVPVWAQGAQKRADKAEKSTAAKDAPAEAPASLMTPRGPTRIDFDDRLVQGQTNKLGAVYLYQRKTPAQPSLLARRQSFRPEIARDLLE